MLIGHNGWPYRIVIVEDAAEVRARIKHTLEDHMDMAVVGEAARWPAALELVSFLDPDVVIIGPCLDHDQDQDQDQDISSIEAIVQERPTTLVITVRLAYEIEERVAFVKAGVLTLLEYSECEQLPIAIRRADHIQQELGAIGAPDRSKASSR